MKLIPLSGKRGTGKFASVDDEDYDLLVKKRWHYASYGYAAIDVEKKKEYMHRLIMGNPKDMEVDHIDGDKLNNTKENLRICSRLQNARNTKPQRGTSVYKGVSWCKVASRWMATIWLNGKGVYLGLFHNESDAANAYDDAARLHFGEYCRTNFK